MGSWVKNQLRLIHRKSLKWAMLWNCRKLYKPYKGVVVNVICFLSILHQALLVIKHILHPFPLLYILIVVFLSHALVEVLRGTSDPRNAPFIQNQLSIVFSSKYEIFKNHKAQKVMQFLWKKLWIHVLCFRILAFYISLI